jgi:hypothetical protein
VSVLLRETFPMIDRRTLLYILMLLGVFSTLVQAEPGHT